MPIFPRDIPAYTLYKTVGIYLEVDTDRGVVLDVDASLYSRLAKELLREIFMGGNLDRRSRGDPAGDRSTVLGECP